MTIPYRDGDAVADLLAARPRRDFAEVGEGDPGAAGARAPAAPAAAERYRA